MKPLILIIDDDPGTILLLKGTLERAGFRTASARGPWDAMGLAWSDPPDLILSDIQMPEVDGPILSMLIRMDDRFEKIPVILGSSLPIEELRLHKEECGAQDTISKPYDIREVIRVVQHWLPVSVDRAGE